ncbi:CAP domain-containing protein [Rhizobium wenxiniae]|uniref:CAP domain-containing protein n=1 Tax=Rhizobium wenxiniae TaxID=1737357 RepID=UPI001C6F5D33|nr:CAP domain-containing protein [Rhizobium wenxiniae]MBW9090051.1 CAP domain-containing protein [Rhizobium wenxiniae]
MTEFSIPSRRGFLVLSGVSLFLAGCSTTAVMTPTPGSEDDTVAALPMVNTLRASKGLSALTLDTSARKAAGIQAIRMAKAQEMKHLIGFGDDFGARMKKSDVALPAAENIAAGQKSVEAAVQAWIDSPRHLENMLGNYRGLGVAMAPAKDGRPYWAMVLSG